MRFLCRLFGHRWKIRYYGWPVGDEWCAVCRWCDKRTARVPGHPFDGLGHIEFPRIPQES